MIFGKVAWILTRQGHISEVVTTLMTESLADWQEKAMMGLVSHKIDKNGWFWPVKLSHYCLEVISFHVTSQTILQWLKSRVCHMSQPWNWQSWQTLAHLANFTLPKQSQVFSKNRSGDIFSRYRAVSVSFSTFLGFFLAFLLFLSNSESLCCHWGTGCPFLDHHLQSNNLFLQV